MKPKKKVVVCSNFAWTVFNFRLSFIKALKKNGYHVVVVTQYDGYEKELKNFVDEIIPLFISRKGINPLVEIMTIINFGWVFFKVKPDAIFLFTVKPVIYGSIIAKLFQGKVVVTITGLGTAFITSNWITVLVKYLYRFALSSVSQVFFQNSTDMDFFINQKIVRRSDCKLIPGSGVDTQYFSYKEPPSASPLKFLLIARMLWDKGVGEYVNAARVVRHSYPSCRFQLLGGLGVQNRTAISSQQMNSWVNEGVVEYLGESDDVRSFIEECSCVVLPSYREGTSRALLEGASMGRPLIATNVPGCREVVQHSVNGYLCADRDHMDLSHKIIAMVELSTEERKAMGIEGRRIVEDQFATEVVNDIFLASLHWLLSGAGQLD